MVLIRGKAQSHSGYPAADLAQRLIKRRPILSDLISDYERTAYEPGQGWWHGSGIPQFSPVSSIP